jgi:outer membrane immunogenic protein
MKKIVLATALLALGTVSALAADLPARHMYTKAAPVAPMSNWNGWYMGGNIGGGWGAGSTDAAFSATSGITNAGLDSNSSGVIGGAQVGYNWQLGTTLFGLETDIQGTGIKGDVTGTTAGATSLTASESLSFLGTVRGRLGVLATPSFLIYATGGFAYGGVDYKASATNTAGTTSFPGSLSDTRTGWTVGGGGEWMVARGWSVKAEYLYVDLGKASVAGVTTPAGVNTANYTFHTQDHIVRAGFNYHFN